MMVVWTELVAVEGADEKPIQNRFWSNSEELTARKGIMKWGVIARFIPWVAGWRDSGTFC